MNHLTRRHIIEIKRQLAMVQDDPIMYEREHSTLGYTNRDNFQRDYTRILYSAAFRRLQGKMQILGINTSAFFRNRLTHSLEVMQTACSIASNIQRECGLPWNDSEMYLIQAAALAHDIGHPAFGHHGERVLDNLARANRKRFEGNAQNFRVLRFLEKKEPTICGLNLTNRTLLAINKYIAKEDQTRTKFMYDDDFERLQNIRRMSIGGQLIDNRTIDVQIIEIADDIAYAVHDLEDALSLGRFNIDELLYEIRDYPTAHAQFESIVNSARKYAYDSKIYGTIQEYSQVFRKRLTSVLTNAFINDVTLKEVDDEKVAKERGIMLGQEELSLNEYDELVTALRKRIFKCITRNPELILYEKRGAVVINRLYELYSDSKRNKEGKLLPPDFRPSNERSLSQCAIDYIAGMMDTFAIKTYEELFNEKFNDIEV